MVLLPVRPRGQVFQQLSGIHGGSNYILYMLYFCYKALLPPCLHHSRTGSPTACWLIQPVLPPGHQHTRVYPLQELQTHRPSGSSWEHGAAGRHVLTPGRSVQALSDRGKTVPLVSPHKACPKPHRSRQAQSTGRQHGTLRPWHLPARVWEPGCRKTHTSSGHPSPGQSPSTWSRRGERYPPLPAPTDCGTPAPPAPHVSPQGALEGPHQATRA